jgi:hypothetical protein
MGLALIFKLGAMPYETVERSMTRFGEEVVPRIRHLLDRDAAATRAAAGVDRAATIPSRAARSCRPPPRSSMPTLGSADFGCPYLWGRSADVAAAAE